MLEPTLFSEHKASWLHLKEKGGELHCQAVIWVPRAIREVCSYIWKYLVTHTTPQLPQIHNYFFMWMAAMESNTQNCSDMSSGYNVNPFFPEFNTSSGSFRFLGSLNSTVVINGETPGRSEPYTKRETVWIGGSSNQLKIPIGIPDDPIQIIQSVVIKLTPQTH